MTSPLLWAGTGDLNIDGLVAASLPRTVWVIKTHGNACIAADLGMLSHPPAYVIGLRLAHGLRERAVQTAVLNLGSTLEAAAYETDC